MTKLLARVSVRAFGGGGDLESGGGDEVAVLARLGAARREGQPPAPRVVARHPHRRLARRQRQPRRLAARHAPSQPARREPAGRRAGVCMGGFI